MSTIQIRKSLICRATILSFLRSVSLFFGAGSRNQGIFISLWAHSISAKVRSNDGSAVLLFNTQNASLMEGVLCVNCLNRDHPAPRKLIESISQLLI